MAGADLAYSYSGLGSNVNPAGMTRVKNGNFSAYGEVVDTSGWRHRDSLGNDADNTFSGLPIIGFGYVFRPDRFENLAFGLALIGQGGVGFKYEELTTTAGNEDELSSMFGVFRLAPSVAWKVNERLSLGLSAGLNYAEATEKGFPETSIAATVDTSAFYGVELEELSGFSGSYRLGLQYKLSDNLRLGLAYGSPTELKLEKGQATVNFEALGLDKVQYNKASVSGLELAEELGIGFVWQLNPRWELAADFSWINWSSAMEKSKVVVSGPSHSEAPSRIVSESYLGFRDQYAVSLGARYRYDMKTSLMAGVTYGRNPVPESTLSPTLSVILDYHFAFGIARQISQNWRWVATALITPTKKVNYQNDSLPLGSVAEQRVQFVGFTFTLERNW